MIPINIELEVTVTGWQSTQIFKTEANNMDAVIERLKDFAESIKEEA